MDNSPPIRTSWLVEAAQLLGLSLADLREAMLDSTPEEPNWEALPIGSYIRLFNWVAAKSGDPHFGLHLAKDVELANFGGGAYMIYHASDLRACCECLARYDQTISQGLSVSFIEKKDSAHLEYRIFQPAIVDLRQDTEMTMAMVTYFFRQYLGDNWHPLKIHFTHAAPEDLSELHGLFGSNIKFEQATTAMWLSHEDLNTQIGNADPYLVDVLRRHADDLQKKIRQKNNISAQVRYFIARTIGAEDCTAEAAAGQLYMSRRTLTRHLRSQGTSFRDLRIEITTDIAKKALSETESQISEIALRLGYSESSAFDRAFKTTTGMSPIQFRQNARIK